MLCGSWTTSLGCNYVLWKLICKITPVLSSWRWMGIKFLKYIYIYVYIYIFFTFGSVGNSTLRPPWKEKNHTVRKVVCHWYITLFYHPGEFLVSHGATQSNYILVCLADVEIVVELPVIQGKDEGAIQSRDSQKRSISWLSTAAVCFLTK